MCEFDFDVVRQSVLSEVYGCPWKYLLYSVFGMKSEVTSWPLIKGTLIHKALEDISNDPKFLDLPEKYQYLEGQAILDQVYRDEFGEEIMLAIEDYKLEVKKRTHDVMEDGRAKGTKYVKPESTNRYKEMHMPFLSDYKRRINEMAHKVIWDNTSLVSIYESGCQQVPNFIRMHNQEQGYNKLYAEMRIDPAIEIFGAKVSGTIDRVEEYDDYVNVYDYKTGATVYQLNYVANSDQLNWYAYATEMILNKPVKFIGIWNTNASSIQRHMLKQRDRDLFLRRWENNISYKQRIDTQIKEVIIKIIGTLDCTKEELVANKEAITDELKGILFAPMGQVMRHGCPCPALYEGNCPYGIDYEQRR